MKTPNSRYQTVAMGLFAMWYVSGCEFSDNGEVPKVQTGQKSSTTTEITQLN